MDSRKVLLFVFSVCIYGGYVLFVVVPSARFEMSEGFDWVRQNGEQRWQKTDHWTETALERVSSSKHGVGNQFKGLESLERTTQALLTKVGSNVNSWMARAATAKSKCVSFFFFFFLFGCG
jgi:hypothetical protein